MTIKAIIFDLDGTLLDTLEDIACAANRVLEAQGFPIHDMDAYRCFVGDGIQILMERVLPEDQRHDEMISTCIRLFREAYGQTWDKRTSPYEGVPDMLDALISQGLKLAVLSNKPDDFTKKCVASFLSSWPFEFVTGYHNGIPRKPDPGGALKIAAHLDILPEQILYLGDTDIDMKTATSAGMFPVGALWGFRSAEELKNNGAKEVIKHPSDLQAVIRKHGKP